MSKKHKEETIFATTILSFLGQIGNLVSFKNLRSWCAQKVVSYLRVVDGVSVRARALCKNLRAPRKCLSMSCVSHQRGFTLSEVMVVVVVVAILVGIAVPMYGRLVKKSRISDALAVLELASAKQEVSLVSNGIYSTTFDDLSLPVDGLVGDATTTAGEGVSIGSYTYRMEAACVIASSEKDNIVLYRNYQTQQTGCQGSNCNLIKGVVENSAVSCPQISLDSDVTAEVVDDICATNPAACCPSDKCYSETEGCVYPTINCIAGRTVSEECTFLDEGNVLEENS